MRFKLIGPFQIIDQDGGIRPAGSPKVSQIMALLLARSNELVERETMIQELWREAPPRSALNTVQTYVHHARRLLAEDLPAGGGLVALTTHSGGYVMQVDDCAVDTKVFEKLVSEGTAELRVRRFEAAVDSLTAALSLWRGSVLSNVPTGDVLTGHTVRLEELRIRALEMRIEAMNGLGRLRETVPELQELVRRYPLNEWFHGQLISALHQGGRRAEALHAYQRLRRTLREELGLEPSSDIQHLHQLVLSPSAPGPSTSPADRSSVVVPLWRSALTG